MTDTPDNPSDPWQSLASELGVRPGEEAAPSQPSPRPPAAQPPRVPPRSSAPPPAKKPRADWQALAGALGIEVPPEPEAPPARKDPVAELLGFPPPVPRSASDAEAERRARAEAKAKHEEDDDFGDWDAPRADRASQQIEDGPDRRRDEEADRGEFEQQREMPPTRDRDADRGGDDRNRGRRRHRGGRGRGRGRPEGRDAGPSSSSGSRGGYRADQPRAEGPPRRYEDRPAQGSSEARGPVDEYDFEVIGERDDADHGGDQDSIDQHGVDQPSGDDSHRREQPRQRDEQGRGGEQRNKRRRRGRRGRGNRDRADQTRMPRSESSGGIVDPPIPGDMAEVDDLEVVFEPLPDELSLHANVEGMPHSEADDDMDMGLPDRPGDRAAHGSNRSHNDHDSDDESR